jgi:hypothetical protein
MSPTGASSTSAELVAGFRVDRKLGDAVWEAFQPELDRRVALRRLEPGARFSAAGWPERRGVVDLYAVVTEPAGTYVATRFVPGARTLAELRGAPAARRRRWIDEVAATLDGVFHGDLTEHDILVDADGRALVTGFGRAPEGATADDDRIVLERLRPQRRRWVLVVPALLAFAVAVVVAVLLLTGGGDEDAPAVTAGATAVGSDLAAGELVTVDCEGAGPSGSSVPCTLMQADLPGRPLTARAAGIVRAWAVRGASGPVGLQVLQAQGDRYVAYNRSATVTIDDADATTVVPADLSVPKGARFALEVGPGGAAGIRRGVAGAGTLRFFGPLRSDPRAAEPGDGDGEELLLRVDVLPSG